MTKPLGQRSSASSPLPFPLPPPPLLARAVIGKKTEIVKPRAKQMVTDHLKPALHIEVQPRLQKSSSDSVAKSARVFTSNPLQPKAENQAGSSLLVFLANANRGCASAPSSQAVERMHSQPKIDPKRITPPIHHPLEAPSEMRIHAQEAPRFFMERRSVSQPLPDYFFRPVSFHPPQQPSMPMDIEYWEDETPPNRPTASTFTTPPPPFFLPPPALTLNQMEVDSEEGDMPWGAPDVPSRN